ncbi:MAG: PRC-barrel domain-containing protein [Planctomycetota bacterium]|nr:PRC-barrel domain-containing protein [Planctomycetota bacterium]MDA1214652.1 PRC-barrel domain-containing protein [Planctomycetota bacterium]
MDRIATIVGTSLLGLCIVVVVADVYAQRTARQERINGKETETNAATSPDRSEAGQLDDKTTGANIRASRLIGMSIQNAQGAEVGEINDLVIDADAGHVRYAAVTYGGFLGLGDKMFAVPFEAFTVQNDPQYPDRHILMLDMSKEQMEGAIGFDEEHWPDFSDPTFTTEVDHRYGVKRDKARKRGSKVDVNIEGRNGIQIDVDSQKNGQ